MDIKNIKLDQLPSVDFEDRKQLPQVAGIYFAIDSNDNIQYIGQSIDIKRRLRRHNRNQQLSELGGVRIAYLEITDTSLLYDIEQALINYYNPRLNNTSMGCDRVNDEPMYQVVSYLTKSERLLLKTHCAVNNITMSTFMKDLILKELNKNV